MFEEKKTYREQERILAYPLNRLDEERSEFRYRVENVREFLRARSSQFYPNRVYFRNEKLTESAAFSAIAKS
jgi:hypothetical protein